MNRINTLFGIEYPIVQGGMVWCSGWRLASAVSNAGGLGLLGAGSMHPETLREHIRKCRQATDKPFGINVPLMYPQLDEVMQLIVDEGVKIVFTSAGNPKLWTGFLKSHGITVVHVVSSSKFARKCEEAGVDAIVAEGFEAGGHNGREETTTLCLIPAVRRATSLPLIAAGGIATGAGMLAVMALGAEGVQIGTRFAFAAESLGTRKLQKPLSESGRGRYDADAQKSFSPRAWSRAISSARSKRPRTGELRPKSLKTLLGKGRAKKACSKATSTTESLEIGQVASLFREQQTAAEIVRDIVTEYRNILSKSREKLSI